jgi:hypothetical protein
MSDTVSGPPPVRQAVLEIQAFAGEGVDRQQASELLDLWRHRHRLERADVNQVLAQFPPTVIKTDRPRR